MKAKKTNNYAEVDVPKTDLETYCISVENPTQKDLNALTELMNKAQDEIVKYIDQLAIDLGVDYSAAEDIYYLRTRSRHTQEKEDYLVWLAKNGKSMPNILEDFKVPKNYKRGNKH